MITTGAIGSYVKQLGPEELDCFAALPGKLAPIALSMLPSQRLRNLQTYATGRARELWAKDRVWALQVRRNYWAIFCEDYRKQLEANRTAWAVQLARLERLTLLCRCASVEYCHRRLLAETILPALIGSTDAGERKRDPNGQ